MKRLLIIFGFIFFLSCQLEAQTVSGTVKDGKTGNTLPGVNIVVKGTQNGTATDNKGHYKLEVSSLQDTLTFSFVGYKKRNIPINERKKIDVILSPQASQLQKIVVSGYQSKQKTNVTGAISSVTSQELESVGNTTVSNPIKGLQGRVPGLFIQTSGNPTGSAVVRIRGVNTLNNNNPLYVIDGFPTTQQNVIQLINPIDIKSIQVLKDAASAAIYGSRASNGVILITTKKSHSKNTLSVDYSSQISLDQFVTKPDLLSSKGRARAQWRAAINDGIDPSTIPNVKYDWTRNPDGTATLNGITIPDMIAPDYKASNTDWLNAITRNGLIQNQNLLISSGGERGGALLSFRYYRDKYILKYKNYKKYSARLNTHYFLTSNHNVKIGENMSFTDGINEGLQSANGVLSGAVSYRPILPIYTETGNYSGPPNGAFADDLNPLMQLDNNKWDQNKNLYLLGNVYAKISLTNNLTINSSFGVNWNNRHLRDIQRKYSTGYISRKNNSLMNLNGEYFEWNFNATAQYNLDISRNSATFLVGTEAARTNTSQTSGKKFGFAVSKLSYFVENAGSGSQIVFGSATASSLLSYFSKIDYSFKDKYLASATIRIDGSSKFGTQNVYGVFPAFSVGWRLADEPFIRKNISSISQLKLRFGWGETGNQAISPDARFGLFTPSYSSSEIIIPAYSRGYDYANYATSYDLKGADSGLLASGFRRIQSGNNSLEWEETSEENIGVDYGFLNNKLTGSFSYYIRHTKNILISPKVLAAVGEGSQQFINGASVKTQGWGANIIYRGHVGNLFSYTLRGNIGHFSNKITKLPLSVAASYPGNTQKTIVGHSINSIFGYVANGIFKTKQQVKEHAKQPGKGLGRIRYKDLNNDGVINSLDQKYLSNGTPNLEYGFNFGANYKGFDLRFFVQGLSGIHIIDGRKIHGDFTGLYAGTNYGTRVLQAWTPKNKDSNIPALSLSDENNEGRISSYFIDNGSYAKLRQVSLGYTFNSISHINRLKVYVQGENLLIIKAPSFVGKDPENQSLHGTTTAPVNAGIDQSTVTGPFPRPRTISMGIRISL